jgi:hypothetical protein
MNPFSTQRGDASFVRRLDAGAREMIGRAEERWSVRERIDADPVADTFVWLYAARAAWLLDESEEAAAWYARTADEMTDLALGVGRKTGTYPYYAELALAAAVQSRRATVLERTVAAVRATPLPRPPWRRSVRRLRSSDPSPAAQATLGAWAAWLAGDRKNAASSTFDATNQLNGLSPQALTRWEASHWADLLSALEALLKEQGDALGTALRGMDRKFGSLPPQTLAVSGWVNETLISLADDWRTRFPQAYDAEDFCLPLLPGLTAPTEVGTARGDDWEEV